MSKGVNDKRIYLIQQKAGNAPAWLRPFMRFAFVSRLWRGHCIRKVNAMSVGEVLNEYYQFTDR